MVGCAWPPVVDSFGGEGEPGVDETVAVAGAIDRGRESFGRRAWLDAYEHLSAAGGKAHLELEDLERLAAAAYLLGRDEESVDVWARAYHECTQVDDAARAARCAFWLAFVLLNKGELARGSGWVHRAQRLLDGVDRDCVEHGYLRYCASLCFAFDGDVAAAGVGFAQAARIGDRFRDPELVALARVGQGRCLIYLGDIAEGMALLDEAMVAITAQEVSPAAVGDLYCTVIEGCQEVFDVRRAQEWTAALSRWCDSQPELVLYRGQCLVHRAELMLLRGAWSDAATEAQRACDRLAKPTSQRALGAAYYVRADLHRLRGEFAKAEETYREASRWGRHPQPGLAQLRLAQGRVDAAVAAMRHALDEAEDAVARSRLLAPYVEIVLAGGDVTAAREAADELSRIATEWNTPLLHALSSHATGSVLLAEGDARAALAALRRAWAGWRELDAPYEGARARMLIGLACRALGDDDNAEMELHAARSVFQQIDAAPDLVRVQELSNSMARRTPGGLTAREVQVLALVATGKTNRAIASELVISEKTVAAHVSSILAKLGLSSRSAATAYAYDHHLV
jgi:DNA-binding CsgD family transcriptional regulator/tetratricopeptide (TPR) repeat protein